MDGSHSDTRMVDLEVEEAEDVLGDQSIGPDSPTSLHRMSKSQTKTWVHKQSWMPKEGGGYLNLCIILGVSGTAFFMMIDRGLQFVSPTLLPLLCLKNLI